MTPPDTPETCKARIQLAGATSGWIACNQDAGHCGDHHAQGDNWHVSWSDDRVGQTRGWSEDDALERHEADMDAKGDALDRGV